MGNVRVNDNPYEITDYTGLITSIENEWGLLQELGLFQEEGIATRSIEVEFRDETLSLLQDAPVGQRRRTQKSDKANLKSFPVPFFPEDDAILPKDIQGKRRVGTEDELDTLASVRSNKLRRLRKNWAQTLEYAKWRALYGEVYSPESTVDVNWYRDIVGSGTAPTAIDIELGTDSTDVDSKLLELEDTIQDNIKTGGMVDRIVVLCSSGWFDDFVNHPDIEEAYKYFSSTQNPMRQLAGTRKYRTFEHQNLEFIRVRGTIGSNALVTADEAIAVPVQEDLYKTFYAPADHLDYVNTVGLSQYAFEQMAMNGRSWNIETESSFIHMVTKPAAIRRLTKS